MRRKLNTTNSFLDLLFNTLLGVVVLFMIAIVMANPPKNGDIQLKAEVLITLEWPDNSRDDVDLFLKTPTSKVPVFYNNRDIKVASLDRDDRGALNDVIQMSDGTTHVVQQNWEHIAIRKFVPGEYIVNVLMYSKVDIRPVYVTVKVERLNPYSVIYSGKVKLSHIMDEKTAVRFKIDKRGKLIERSTLQESLARGALQRRRP